MSLRVACVLVPLSVLGCLGASARSSSFPDPAGALRPVDLRCEGAHDPLAVHAPRPRLSWRLQPVDPSERGLRQTAYRILVASSLTRLNADEGDLLDSGRVPTDRSIHIPYTGSPLGSRARCWWKVRVWDGNEAPSDWSEPATWRMGLLEPDDWKGMWIGLEEEYDEPDSPLSDASWIWHDEEDDPASAAAVGRRFFRRAFDLPADRTVGRATLWLTADNAFTALVGGVVVGQGSNFNQLTELDVTSQLRPGLNVLAVEATNAGDLANPAGLLGRLRIELSEGPDLEILTDETWSSAASAQEGWAATGFNATTWDAVRVLGRYGAPPWGEVARPDARRLPARYLRKELDLGDGVERATAYVCGLGLFELEVNGRRVGSQVLAPSLTEYPQRVAYVAFDITGHLGPGRNAIGVTLGNGRYFAPRLRVPTLTRTYGFPKLLLNVVLEHGDGAVEVVATDATWRITDEGPIRANSEYDGEEYDARLELAGWSSPGFDDSSWPVAQVVEPPGGRLVAQGIDPIRVTETVRPVALTQPLPGAYVFDLGQNIVGWCRLRVQGPRGGIVTLRHAESLRDDGTLYLDNLRSAKATDVYVLGGDGVEVYEPRFTYHGFRYVEVRGFPGEPTLSSLEGRVVHDDLERTGSFTCSHELLQRVHDAIVWGLRGNYRSVPTDCPQRDERQGWLGDRSAESRGEANIFDVSRFYAKWLEDIRDAQLESGSVPDVAPPYWPMYTDNVTWPSSFIIIPGHLYDLYGDDRVLEDHYEGMTRWIEYMSGFLEDGLLSRDTYGDWCVPPEEPHLIHSQDPARTTPGSFIATAYFYHDLTLLSRYARILGRQADSERLASRAARLKTAFNESFLDPDTATYANGSQTSCVLPLAFDLVPPEHRARVFERLVTKIEDESDGHVGTGLIGGQWLMRALSDGGRPDVAFAMATKTTYPSWGYMIAQGATTIWELWNGDTADPAMNSRNHVMLVGDLLTWLYEHLGGIRPDPEGPGFRRVLIRPVPVGDLAYVSVSRLTPIGTVFSRWEVDGDDLELRLTIPPNSRARVDVPARAAEAVTEGGVPATDAPGVRLDGFSNGHARYEVGSGTYRFRSAGWAHADRRVSNPSARSRN